MIDLQSSSNEIVGFDGKDAVTVNHQRACSVLESDKVLFALKWEVPVRSHISQHASCSVPFDKYRGLVLRAGDVLIIRDSCGDEGHVSCKERNQIDVYGIIRCFLNGALHFFAVQIGYCFQFTLLKRYLPDMGGVFPKEFSFTLSSTSCKSE